MRVAIVVCAVALSALSSAAAVPTSPGALEGKDAAAVEAEAEASSAKARADRVDRFVRAIRVYAQDSLDKRGTFHPYGAMLTHAGEIEIVTTHDDKENTPIAELLEQLDVAIHDVLDAGSHSLAATVVDVRAQPAGPSREVDAIRIAVESDGGVALEFFWPYRILPDGGIEYGERFTGTGDRNLFAVQP